MKIAIIGAGYVGSGVAVVYGGRHGLSFVDVDQAKIDCINQGHSPIDNPSLERCFSANASRISATASLVEACKNATCCFVCVPTPLDERTGKLDTSGVASILENLEALENAKTLQIFVRSTLNILDSKLFSDRFPTLNIHCFPEFLREAYVYEDSLRPSRIVIGNGQDGVFMECIEEYKKGIENHPQILITSNEEAMAIKLFSNAYLATRIAFFNEVDSYAAQHGLDSSIIIRGMGLDSRIGDYYNVPSPGFGGKCLPKDLKASATSMKESGVEDTLLEGVCRSNEERKKRSK